MHQFKDTAGRAWRLEINIAAVKAVKGLVGVDLYGLLKDHFKPLSELLGDPCKLVDVLFVLCQQQAAEAKVSDEDFGRSLGGDSLEAAADAFLLELADFFPVKGRKLLQRIWQKGRQVVDRLEQEATAELETLDPEAILRTWKASHGKQLESPVSTPTP